MKGPSAAGPGHRTTAPGARGHARRAPDTPTHSYPTRTVHGLALTRTAHQTPADGRPGTLPEARVTRPALRADRPPPRPSSDADPTAPTHDGAMRHQLLIVHGSPTAAELAAVTAVLSAVVLGGAVCVDGHHRMPRAHWDRSWRPHPLPHSWCTGGNTPPFHRH